MTGSVVGRRVHAVVGPLPVEGRARPDGIYTLNEPAGVSARCDMLQLYIARRGAKEWDPGTDQHGHARDNEALDEPGPQEALNGDPAVHVYMPDAARRQARHDFRRRPRHALHHRPWGGRSEGVCAENEN